MKKNLLKILVIAIFLVPLSYMYLNNAEWQIIAIVQLSICLSICVANYDKFERITLSKEGIELRKGIEQAKSVINEISTSMDSMLNLYMDQILIVGGPSEKLLDLYKTIKHLVKEYNIENAILNQKILNLEDSIIRHFNGELELIRNDTDRTLKSLTLISGSMAYCIQAEQFTSLIVEINKIIKSSDEENEFVEAVVLEKLIDEHKAILKMDLNHRWPDDSEIDTTRAIYPRVIEILDRYKKSFDLLTDKEQRKKTIINELQII